ncbi:MAG: Sapep family Mn(2+)-dependent dipeptidase [Firmicutes bacterium]|nr:Sapep family Mn(2+)-dependent dipeptidase [Bacillota bacterium]
MNRQLEDFLERHEHLMHEDLQELVAIPSVSDDIENVKKALEATLDLARKYGFEARSVLNDQVGIIEMGEGDETLGLLAHVDVVPPGDLGQWTFDPFRAINVEGRMYGRGTIDDKGPVIACLYAMRAVKELGLPLHKKVQLILGTQEEVEWVDMDAYVKEYPLPDYGFTPDDVYPICNIEKGYLDQVMEFDVKDEEGSNDDGKAYLIALDVGAASNVVPDKAVATLSNGEQITARGRSCHSSEPEKGDNAIFELARILKERDLPHNKLLDLLYDVTEYFSDCKGSKLGLCSETEYYQGEFVHRNMQSPTVFKAADGKAELTVNVRFPYGEDVNRIIKTFDEWAAQRNGRTAYTDAQPAVFVSKDSPFLKAFADAYEDVTDRINEFTLAYGGSYAKAMPNIVAWGPIFPEEEDTTHSPNEYIDLENMMLSAKMFAEAIATIALSEQSFK